MALGREGHEYGVQDGDYWGPGTTTSERVRIRALEAVLAQRERELLELKGPCRNSKCRLHRAHSGPCYCEPAAQDTGQLDPEREQ